MKEGKQLSNLKTNRPSNTPPPPPRPSQAGAVGYVDGERIHELREGRLNLALWAECCGNANTPVYTTPPAAVPLEELVKLKEAYCRCDGTQEAEDAAILAILNKIDELAQLITVHSGHKERSNG